MNSPATAIRCLLAVAMLVLLGSSKTSSVAAAANDQHQGLDTAVVDGFIKDQMASGGLPGVAVAITRGKEILYFQGYGHDSTGTPITSDTPFRIASLSKSFTALAVMQLVEAGKIRLDEPARSYLRDFETADHRSADITVRQLLNQTSGLADRGFPELSLPQPASLTTAVERLRSAKVIAEPGTEWNYHNPNYQLAARLVEVASGEPFGEYLKQHVFSPLGMDHSIATINNAQNVTGLADGHSFAYGAAVALPGPGYFVSGSGGIVSTAADLARWLVMQNNDGVGANGARILSAHRVKEMHAPSEPGGYGLGWEINGSPDHPTRIAHGGADFTFSSYQVFLPESGYGIAVLFNSATPLWIEQTSITEGLISIVTGRALSPNDGASSATIDFILAIVTITILTLGVVAAFRSRWWASRRMQRPIWRVALRLVPHAGVIALLLVFPSIAVFLVGGRDVTWRTAFYGWPALVVLVAAAALVEIAVIAARISHLVIDHRKSAVPSSARG